MTHPGLCAGCRHARRTGNRRGSVFWLCLAHRFDPDMPKYPALPVRDCRHYDPQPAERAEPPDNQDPQE